MAASLRPSPGRLMIRNTTVDNFVHGKGWRTTTRKALAMVLAVYPDPVKKRRHSKSTVAVGVKSWDVLVCWMSGDHARPTIDRQTIWPDGTGTGIDVEWKMLD